MWSSVYIHLKKYFGPNPIQLSNTFSDVPMGLDPWREGDHRVFLKKKIFIPLPWNCIVLVLVLEVGYYWALMQICSWVGGFGSRNDYLISTPQLWEQMGQSKMVGWAALQSCEGDTNSNPIHNFGGLAYFSE